jgi:hypothetical protein
VCQQCGNCRIPFPAHPRKKQMKTPPTHLYAHSHCQCSEYRDAVVVLVGETPSSMSTVKRLPVFTLAAARAAPDQCRLQQNAAGLLVSIRAANTTKPADGKGTTTLPSCTPTLSSTQLTLTYPRVAGPAPAPPPSPPLLTPPTPLTCVADVSL